MACARAGLARLLPEPRSESALRLYEEGLAGVDVPARPANLDPQEPAALRATRTADRDFPRRDSRLHPPRSGRGDPVGDHDDGLLRSTAPHKHRAGLAAGLLERPG